MNRSLIFLLIMYSLSIVKAEIPVIEIDQENEALYINGDATGTYLDESNKMSFQDISQLPLDQFEWNKKLYNDKTNVTYWIAFRLQDLNEKKRKWIFEILDARQHEVVLYVPSGDGKYSAHHNGIKYPFHTRKYLHKNFVMDIYIPNNEPRLFYLKLHTKVYGAMVFKLRTNREFSSYSLYEYFHLGLFYGILLIFSIYNFLLFLSSRNRAYLFYVLYVVSWIWFTMVDDNMGFHFIWPNYPTLNPIGHYLAQPLLMTMFILYSRAFLNSYKFNKRQNALLHGLGAIYVIYHFVSRVVEVPFLYHILFIAPFLLILWYSLLAYRKGFYPARFFIIGNSFIFIGYIVRLIKDEGMFNSLLENHEKLLLLTNYSRNFSLIIDIIVLSLALVDRLKYIKREEEKAKSKYIEQLEINDKLKDTVNKELEGKVQERTHQLEQQAQLLDEANNELRNQANEIQRMNAILDKKNYVLKKEVVKSKNERILSPEIGFDAFLEIYPDDLSVMRFLDSIKSERGYKCVMCGNETYLKGTKKFSKKCTNCHNEETITSYTFLHRCKLPLEKVLYIIYKIMNDPDGKNVTKISEDIDLRRKTVSDYKSKVKETITELKKKKEEINIKNVLLFYVK